MLVTFKNFFLNAILFYYDIRDPLETNDLRCPTAFKSTNFNAPSLSPSASSSRPVLALATDYNSSDSDTTSDFTCQY